jgi:hypothetical protein
MQSKTIRLRNPQTRKKLEAVCQIYNMDPELVVESLIDGAARRLLDLFQEEQGVKVEGE